jgi:hypothetical protein
MQYLPVAFASPRPTSLRISEHSNPLGQVQKFAKGF